MPVAVGMPRLNPPEAGPKLVLFEEPEPKGQTVMMGKAWTVVGAEAGAGFGVQLADQWVGCRVG